MNHPDDISLRAFKLFIEVCEALNFSVVARRHGISPSQVSRIIHQLEDSLGQQLFYRNTRATIPTENGRLFAESVRQTLQQLEDARRLMEERTREPSGLVRINAPVFFGQRHIAPGLAGLSALYPRLNIELVLTDDYIDPHRHAADVIFRIGTLSDSSYHVRIFGTQRFHLAASPEYLHNHALPQSPEDLTDHHCLLYRGSSGPNRWLFRRPHEQWVHFPVSPLLTSNNAETLLISALQGMGIVLFPDWLIGDKLQTGELKALLPGFTASIATEPQYITAIYPGSRHPPLNIRAVIDYYLSLFGTPLYWQVPG